MKRRREGKEKKKLCINFNTDTILANGYLFPRILKVKPFLLKIKRHLFIFSNKYYYIYLSLVAATIFIFL